jgi:hypothetical protein
MFRPTFVAILLALPCAAFPADDLTVAQLEQDVRDLQRQLQALSRLIDSRNAAPPAAVSARSAAPAVATQVSTAPWVDAAKWRKLQPGMGELEVLSILGSPTAMRAEGNDRVLLYALEIGASGFLGGSVRLRERSVVSVQQPVLQ